MAVVDLDKDTFNRFVDGSKVTVVDFWAEWCGPCQMMAPIIKQLSEEMRDSVAFGAVDLDANQELGMSKSIMSIPTMIVYVNGQEVDRIVGARSKTSLRDTIAKVSQV